MCQHLPQGEEGRENGNENGADRDVHPIDTLSSTAGYDMWNHLLGQRRDNVKRGMTSMSLFLLTGLPLLLVLCLPQSWFSLKNLWNRILVRFLHDANLPTLQALCCLEWSLQGWKLMQNHWIMFLFFSWMENTDASLSNSFWEAYVKNIKNEMVVPTTHTPEL